MNIILKKGMDDRYGFGLYSEEGCEFWHPARFETPVQAAEEAKRVVALIRQEGINGVYTEAGERWV